MAKKIYYTDYKDDLLNNYLKDISRYKVLDSSEISKLVIKAQQGDGIARNMLIQANLRFVVTVAKQYQNRGISLMDLISAGNEGLIKCIDKYDINKGTAFLTYAGWWIKQCIYNTIYSHGNEIRLPVTQRLLVIKILDTTNKFIQKHSRNPSIEELSELTGIDTYQINFLSQFSNKLLSVDDFIGGDEENTQLCDIIPDNEIPLDDQINRAFILSNLDKMLESLPDREQDLIRMIYGIGMDVVDSRTVSDMFGVGRERIRQMKESALKRLKKKFGNTLKTLI